jgi:hypothetical protein
MYNNGNGNNRIAGVIGAPVTTITITIATSENSSVMNEEITLESGKIYLGIYTFLISGPALRIEFIDNEVASAKKLKIICPAKRYTGKFGISNLKILEKTAIKTAIIKSGFNRLQR